jgi:phage tail sheath protein FI
VRVEDRNSTATPPLNQPLTTADWYPGGGSDGLVGVTAATYQGQDADDADRRTGLFTLLNTPRVSIVAIPGQTGQDVQQALMAHCENNKYRFAVLDPSEHASLDTVQSQRSLYDSKYAALYYPWIQIFDPLQNKPVFAPPSGHVCGLYALTDQEVGVHKAPANAVLRQVRDLQATITKGQQDILNPRGINAIRAFPGRGIRVWGARTTSSDALWRYVNVRRLFIFLEQSIDEGSQYAVFEPNDLPLWNRLKASLTAFLTTVWRAGALQGATEAEAFFVKVGLGETMTQDDIDNGRVIILIGVAPVKPAEFVIFRIGQKVGGSDVSE